MTNTTRSRTPLDKAIEDVLNQGVSYAFIEDPESEVEWLSLANYLNQNDRLNTVTEINLPTGIIFYHIAAQNKNTPTYLFKPRVSGKMTITVDAKGSFVPNLKVNGSGSQQSLGNDFYELSVDVTAGTTYSITLNKPLTDGGLYNIVARVKEAVTPPLIMPSLISEGDLITTGAAIDKKGDVYVWGFRGSSQQGNGKQSVNMNEKPQKVNGLSNAIQLVGGAYHLLALCVTDSSKKSGDVWGWGQNLYGEAGSQATYVSTPQKVLSDAVQISAGEYCSAALDTSGRVWTWGHNTYGQLGNGTNKNSRTPVQVNLSGETARLVGSAYEGGFAVTNQNHVWAWGDNEASGLGFKGTNYGTQQIITTPTRVTNLDQYADQIIYISGGNGWGEALLSDGTVIGWGLRASLGCSSPSTANSSDQPIVIMTGVQQLFARYVGSCALTKDGKIFTWGQTEGSAFKWIYGNVPTLHNTVSSPITRIGGGKEHLFYETEDGRLYGVGYNDLYKLNQKQLGAPYIQWPGSEITLY